MTDTGGKPHSIHIDTNDPNIPNSFNHDGGSISVDYSIISLARLLGKQAAREFLLQEAANDNHSPKVKVKHKKR